MQPKTQHQTQYQGILFTENNLQGAIRGQKAQTATETFALDPAFWGQQPGLRASIMIGTENNLQKAKRVLAKKELKKEWSLMERERIMARDPLTFDLEIAEQKVRTATEILMAQTQRIRLTVKEENELYRIKGISPHPRRLQQPAKDNNLSAIKRVLAFKKHKAKLFDSIKPLRKIDFAPPNG